jgi:hypothetical protein
VVVVWRRLDDAAERASAGWGLYLTAIYAVSLIVATASLLGTAASFIDSQEPRWDSPLSNGLAWAAIAPLDVAASGQTSHQS